VPDTDQPRGLSDAEIAGELALYAPKTSGKKGLAAKQIATGPVKVVIFESGHHIVSVGGAAHIRPK
jgi:hypothetical protein